MELTRDSRSANYVSPVSSDVCTSQTIEVGGVTDVAIGEPIRYQICWWHLQRTAFVIFIRVMVHCE